MNKALATLGVGILAASLTFAGTTTASANEGVCPVLDTGHLTPTTDSTSWDVVAPEGSLIAGYCVKAGSIKRGLGPESFTLDSPVQSLTLTHSSGKDISHYALTFVAVPVVEEPPVEEPEEPPVEPPYTPPVLNCGEGTVPGWLNEFGDPTSCVSNNPCPEVEFGETCPVDVVPVVPEVPAVETPEVETPIIPSVIPPAVVVPVELPTVPVAEELARTGSPSPLIPAGIASLLLAAGAFLIRKAVRA